MGTLSLPMLAVKSLCLRRTAALSKIGCRFVGAPAAAAAVVPAASDHYETRTQRTGMFARPDPIVWPDDPGVVVPKPLSESQLAQYEDQGFLLVRQVIGQEDVKECIEELEELQGDVDAAAARHGSRVALEPDGGCLRSVYALHLDPVSVMGRISTSLPIVSCAQQILGGDVYVHQWRLNLQKAFHGTGFSWHSDFETWHSEDGLPTPRAMSAVLLIDRNREVNGSLMVIPGSHRWFLACPGRQGPENWKTSLRSQHYGSPGEQELSLLAEAGDVVHCTGEPGDVLIFDNNLLHASASNRSPWHRRNVFTVFNSVHNRLEHPFYAEQPRPEHIGHREHCATLHPLQKKV